jgi:uncharacterized protein (TIGR02266 family)
MAEGNRKDPRARVLNMTVRYKSATVDEFIENHSHDISRGGIFIKTRSPFPAGTLLKFEVRIAEDQKLMHGVGRVVWRREADRAEESFPAGMGIKFIKTGEGASDLINQLIAAREGVESSFDAGVRENVSVPNGRHSAIPTAPAPPIAAARATTAPPTSAPSLSVESAPRSAVVPTEAETAVTNPAKKRQDQAPEKRKVVLQGPALDAPSSRAKPSAVTARPAGDSAPSRNATRGSIAEETTEPRVRHATKKTENESPKLGGLIVILALVGLVVFVVNRLRGPGAEPLPPTVGAEPPPASPAAALPPPPAPEPPPAAQAAPAEADPADPNGAGIEVPAGAQPAPTGAAADPAAAAPAAAPTGTSPAPNAPPSEPAPPVAAAQNPTSEPPPPPPPVAATQPPPTPPPAAKAPAVAAPSATPPAPKATAPAPARPAPAPVPPKPRATAPKPPAAQPTPPVAKPAEPAPKPPATNGSGGDAAGTAAPAAKKPAPPAQPTPPPPAPAPPVPSNDNPY